MSILTWIEEKKRLKLLNAPKYVNPASDQPDLLSEGAPRGGRSSKGLWTRCDKCGVILYIKHLKENQRVCFGCTYHLQMSSQERIENLLDKESWRPFDETVSPCDPLEFHDQRNYTDRLRDAQDKTGLQDAIQTGTGLVDGIPVALGIMDFDFMGGSMGSVVGEKITRLIEYATQEGLTLLLVCASGGARMQEGVFSLMQMAKISSALQIYQSCANLLYISILTSPTTGGVTASFAMLGDIIFAEPKALIAFAGRRVIEQTLCEDLPEDFQTSEYMLHHGLVDLIVPRRFLRQALSESIRLYKNAPFKKPGRIPFGVQNPISFLTEEKLRRQCQTELDLDITRSRRLTKSLDFVQATPVPGMVESGLANSNNALTDQSRAINQPSVGSGRSVRQEDGTMLRLAPKGANTLLASEVG
jgi:acetyl-CoA carboxylase carboxyl transferase subunit beta